MESTTKRGKAALSDGIHHNASESFIGVIQWFFSACSVVVNRLLTMLTCNRLAFDKPGINVETQGLCGVRSEGGRRERKGARAQRRREEGKGREG